MLSLYRKTFCILIFILLSPYIIKAQEDIKVLFVGNSYTYFWNLPRTVEAMAASQDMTLEIRQSTAGGVSLKNHWNGDKNLQSQELITSGDWTYVVLQNHSLSSIENPEEFFKYGKKFIELVKESGATPILYITWARKYNPLMQKTITEAYERLAEETGVIVAPVGQAWDRVRILRPDLDLYFDDGSHPSPAGTYLASCVFYHILTGKTSRGIPPRIKTTDKYEEELYLSILSEENAQFLQQVVDELMSTSETAK